MNASRPLACPRYFCPSFLSPFFFLLPSPASCTVSRGFPLISTRAFSSLPHHPFVFFFPGCSAQLDRVEAAVRLPHHRSACCAPLMHNCTSRGRTVNRSPLTLEAPRADRCAGLQTALSRGIRVSCLSLPAVLPGIRVSLPLLGVCAKTAPQRPSPLLTCAPDTPPTVSAPLQSHPPPCPSHEIVPSHLFCRALQSIPPEIPCPRSVGDRGDRCADMLIALAQLDLPAPAHHGLQERPQRASG